MNTILVVAFTAAIIFAIERLAAAHRLPSVTGWWARVVLFNSLQAGIAFVATISWDRWMAAQHFDRLAGLPLWSRVAVGYIVITFIYYWWHRARHGVPMLWRWCHQLHHSPARIEVVMSFYKHPLELVVNGILSSSIVYLVLGLDPTAAAIAVLLTGLAELVYHANLKTPYWLGFFFQRPEMHRVHHQRGHHRSNYSDLPIWDMLFGTFDNPRRSPELAGFPYHNERRVADLLLGRRIEA